jgi:hypothetical protein
MWQTATKGGAYNTKQRRTQELYHREAHQDSTNRTQLTSAPHEQPANHKQAQEHHHLQLPRVLLCTYKQQPVSQWVQEQPTRCQEVWGLSTIISRHQYGSLWLYFSQCGWKWAAASRESQITPQKPTYCLLLLNVIPKVNFQCIFSCCCPLHVWVGKNQHVRQKKWHWTPGFKF